jgi:sugar phosphate isomerase/epimerase
VVAEIKELAGVNVVGNIHLSDNRGLDDSHLWIGEGNAPIEEVLNVFSRVGYKGFIVIEGTGQGAVEHAMDYFGIVPRASDGELKRDFNPRDAVSGIRWKDDLERPSFGKDE